MRGELQISLVRGLARYYGLGTEELLERRKRTGRERQFAIYLSNVFSGEKNSEVGRVFGVSIQVVTNVLGRMKKVLEKDAELNSMSRRPGGLQDIVMFS